MVGTLVTVPRKDEVVDVSKEISFRVVEIRHKNNQQYVEVNLGFPDMTQERYLEIREVGFREHD